MVYEPGVQITLTAIAASCCVVLSCTGDVGTIGDVNTPIIGITTNLDYAIAAHFALRLSTGYS